MEIEAKYTVLDQKTYTALTRLRQIARFSVEDGEPRAILDTYQDTPDCALLAAGYACRCRRENDRTYLTLKGTRAAGGTQDTIHRRTELEIPIDEAVRDVPDLWPESRLRELVLEITQGQPLTDILNVQQARRIRYLRAPEGDLIAELSLDAVKIRTANKRHAFTELEVEVLEAGSEADLAQITACLADMEGLTAQPTSKFDRGLAFVTISTGKKGDPAEISAGDPIEETARTILRPLFLKMLMHEQGTYLGKDPEALHDMRVATRRIRTFLRIAEPYLDTKALQPVYNGLRKTARILGAVRDMDVFREKTEDYLVRSETPGTALQRLMQIWNVEHARRRNDMLAHLSSADYSRFKQAFWALLENGIPGKQDPVQVKDVVSTVVRAQLCQLQTSSAAVQQSVKDFEAYHQIRIDGKMLRYSLEFFRAILGPETAPVIEALKDLQDHFGALQDAVVAARHLRAVTTYATWETPKQAKTLWLLPSSATPASPHSPNAVWDYLNAREAEIEALTAGAVQVWQTFQERSIPDLVRASLVFAPDTASNLESSPG